MATQSNVQTEAPEGLDQGPVSKLKHTGYCHNDAQRVDDGHLFCSRFCRLEWIKQHPAQA